MTTYIHRPKELGGTIAVPDGGKYGPLAIGIGDNPLDPTHNTYANLFPRKSAGLIPRTLPGHRIISGVGDREVSPKDPQVELSQTVFEYKKD